MRKDSPKHDEKLSSGGYLSLVFFKRDIGNTTAGPDKTLHKAVSDQDLHCLLTECYI